MHFFYFVVPSINLLCISEAAEQAQTTTLPLPCLTVDILFDIFWNGASFTQDVMGWRPSKKFHNCPVSSQNIFPTVLAAFGKWEMLFVFYFILFSGSAVVLHFWSNLLYHCSVFSSTLTKALTLVQCFPDTHVSEFLNCLWIILDLGMIWCFLGSFSPLRVVW